MPFTLCGSKSARWPPETTASWAWRTSSPSKEKASVIYSVASVGSAKGSRRRFNGCWPIRFERSSLKARGARSKPATGNQRSRPRRRSVLCWGGLRPACHRRGPRTTSTPAGTSAGYSSQRREGDGGTGARSAAANRTAPSTTILAHFRANGQTARKARKTRHFQRFFGLREWPSFAL